MSMDFEPNRPAPGKASIFAFNSIEISGSGGVEPAMRFSNPLAISSVALIFLISSAITAQSDPATGQEARIAAATQAIAANPRDAEAYVKRAVCYMERGPDGGKPALRNLDLAVADLFTAIVLNPQNYSARQNYARAAYLLGYWDLALVEFTRTIKLNPSSAPSFLGRGWTYFEFCLFDEAGANFTRAVSLDPSLRANMASRQDMADRKTRCASSLTLHDCFGVYRRKDGSLSSNDCGILPYLSANPKPPPPELTNLMDLYHRQQEYGRVNHTAARSHARCARCPKDHQRPTVE